MTATSTGIPPSIDGSLPAGIHDASWGGFLTRFATNDRRRALVDQLRPVLDEFAALGVERVAIGGSFVTDKARPGDIDLAWLPPERAAESFPLQTRVHDRTRAVAPEVHLYRADELFTDIHLVRPGETYLEFFQHTRTGASRGIVSLDTSPVNLRPSLRAITGRLLGAVGLVR